MFPQIEGSVHMTQTDRLHNAHTGKQTSERRVLSRTGNELRSSSRFVTRAASDAAAATALRYSAETPDMYDC